MRINTGDGIMAQDRKEYLKRYRNLTELEEQKILLYYKISEYLGKDWQVDHIKPISKGGLHHPDNLQVIPKEHNRKKYTDENYIIPENLIVRI